MSGDKTTLQIHDDCHMQNVHKNVLIGTTKGTLVVYAAKEKARAWQYGIKILSWGVITILIAIHSHQQNVHLILM